MGQGMTLCLNIVDISVGSLLERTFGNTIKVKQAVQLLEAFEGGGGKDFGAALQRE